MLTRETAQKIIDSQLGGVMFHSDMVNLFTVLGNNKMRVYQEKQLTEELHTFLKTKQHMYESFGELFLPSPKASSSRLAVPTKVSCDKECYELCCKAMAVWKEWEESVRELYETADTEDDTPFFRRLLSGVEHEITKIKRLTELR